MAREGGEAPDRLGVQNHRSLITMVSPGRTGKVIGTALQAAYPFCTFCVDLKNAP